MFQLINNFKLALLILIGSIIPAFPQHGYLRIDCPLPGLKVKLDEHVIGLTPLALLPLKVGTYQLSVTHPDKLNWGNEDWATQILIVAGDTTVVQPYFIPKIILRSKPFDARVFLNSEYLGNTPLYVKFPPPDDGMIVITKEGFESFSISASDIKSSTIDVALKRINTLKGTSQLLKIQHEKRIGRNRKISYCLMALSIGTGITSVYFKDQANKNYDQYLTAGNIKDMNRYYNACKKNDRFSSISFGLFEVTFVLSFYTLFKTIGN